MKATQALYTKMQTLLALNSAMVRSPLQLMLKEQGYKRDEIAAISERILTIVNTTRSEAEAAQKIWDLLGHKSKLVTEKLVSRGALVWSQVAPHVKGHDLLDFGCGDGRISQFATEAGHTVCCMDVADYRVAGLESTFVSRWHEVDTEFDTALALVVFHHCENPCKEILELRKVAKRLVVIESVVDEAMPWAAQALVDWLYNRGLHPGAAIPVPGNFRTVEAWRETFDRYGFQVIREKDLGIDLPIVPEHHHLFVLQ